MSMFIASLSSGSNGNCYYIGNQDEAVLIDAGISCREIEQRLKRLELPIRKIKAICVTHEHSDHISGISRLSRKYKIPTYITSSTFEHGRLRLRSDLVRFFQAYEVITVGKLSITPFPTMHDASDPHSFVVENNQVKVGVFTDIGAACDLVKKYFSQCHAAFLESNYDVHMLSAGSYSAALKSRIRGGRGHLSNDQAAQLFLKHRSPFMSHLFLSHLSEENNSPGIVEKLFRRIAGKTEIIVSPRYEESAVYHIHAEPGLNRRRLATSQFQLSLFQ